MTAKHTQYYCDTNTHTHTHTLFTRFDQTEMKHMHIVRKRNNSCDSCWFVIAVHIGATAASIDGTDFPLIWSVKEKDGKLIHP